MKNKNTAGFLALFLGGIGVHRFYLGQTGLGFLYLIFCWTFIPTIAALVDAIMFWTMSSDDFDIKYNKSQQQPTYMYNTGNTAKEIEKLHNLKEKGIITAEEFEYKKQQLLM